MWALLVSSIFWNGGAISHRSPRNGEVLISLHASKAECVAEGIRLFGEFGAQPMMYIQLNGRAAIVHCEERNHG